MTRDADLKAKVRARMELTGESYTLAREALLAQEPPDRTTGPAPRAVPAAPALVPEAPATVLGPPDPVAEKAIRSFFDGDRLRSIPSRRRPRAAVLMHLLTRFERGREYAEREVNDILRTAHEDISTLRRELVDYRWLLRSDSVYRVTDRVPERGPDELQEVPSDEARRLDMVPRSWA